MLLLIERRASETRSELAASVELLAHEFWGDCSEPVEFDLWESRAFQGKEFLRLVCAASAAQELVTRASTGSGNYSPEVQLFSIGDFSL